MTVRSFYVRVYKPAKLFEYEVEVDDDLIGLDDEENVSDDAATYALRTAIRKAKAGELEQTEGIDEEFVALVHDEVSMKLTTAQLLRTMRCEECDTEVDVVSVTCGECVEGSR